MVATRGRKGNLRDFRSGVSPHTKDTQEGIGHCTTTRMGRHGHGIYRRSRTHTGHQRHGRRYVWMDRTCLCRRCTYRGFVDDPSRVRRKYILDQERSLLINPLSSCHYTSQLAPCERAMYGRNIVRKVNHGSSLKVLKYMPAMVAEPFPCGLCGGLPTHQFASQIQQDTFKFRLCTTNPNSLALQEITHSDISPLFLGKLNCKGNFRKQPKRDHEFLF